MCSLLTDGLRPATSRWNDMQGPMIHFKRQCGEKFCAGRKKMRQPAGQASLINLTHHDTDHEHTIIRSDLWFHHVHRPTSAALRILTIPHLAPCPVHAPRPRNPRRPDSPELTDEPRPRTTRDLLLAPPRGRHQWFSHRNFLHRHRTPLQARPYHWLSDRKRRDRLGCTEA